MVPRARSAHRPERTITPRPPAPRGGGSPRTVARVARTTCQPNRTRDSPLRPMGVRGRSAANGAPRGWARRLGRGSGRAAWEVGFLRGAQDNNTVLGAPPGTWFCVRRLGRGCLRGVRDVVVCAAFGTTWFCARRWGPGCLRARSSSTRAGDNGSDIARYPIPAGRYKTLHPGRCALRAQSRLSRVEGVAN